MKTEEKNDPLAKLPPAGYDRLAIERRFWVKVDKRAPDECWPWVAYCGRRGYGQFRIDYYLLQAHRVAWELVNRAIPEGMWVLHACDNPCCVNPAHLFLGTHADNMADMVRKGRGAGSEGEKNHSAKLAEEAVRAIRKEYADTPATLRELGRKYGVHSTTILMVVRRDTWKHVR